MDVTNLVIAATLGGSAFAAIAGGGHWFIQGERYRRRCRRLDDLIHNAKMREADAIAKADAFTFVAETPYLMCGGCGKSVPTTDGFSIADHDCPHAIQGTLFQTDEVSVMFLDGVEHPATPARKIPIGFTGHLHPLK